MIEFDSTTKIYRSLLGRSVTAVEDFSLRVAEGEVLGIAGPNGAGKSTLISLLLGYIAPTKGTVTIGGMSPRRYVEKNGIGYLSELMTI
ncbi:MAG TPA: ATP-binding cassette domain-containing protein, partial [Gemmatimonadaceae bacterium]|nr:ATP-binding cassette domain-containing protein [Gemmatimonadaceae bacterium]